MRRIKAAIGFVFFVNANIALTTRTENSFGAPVECEPLRSSSQNVMVRCEDASNGSNDCTVTQSPGTTASYKCKDYFTPFGPDSNTNEEHQLECLSNGKWSKSLSRFESYLCIEDCGQRKINPKPLIIHGTRTQRASWPWHVAIFRKATKTYRNGTRVVSWPYICGGSIVRNSVVLTAAHCVTTDDAQDLPPSEFKVVLGAQTSVLSLNQLDSNVQILSVKKIYFIYESYDPRKDFQADIAILHLEPGMVFNDYVLPVCLPRDNVLELDALRPRRVGHVVGFGVDATGNVSQYLKYGELVLKSKEECFHTLDTKLSESQFCAGTYKGAGQWTSVCSGDSGGGLVAPAAGFEKYYVYVSLD